MRFLKALFNREKRFSFIKTIFYNFKLLPIKQAVHFPLLIGKRVVIQTVNRGGVKLDQSKSFSVRIGTFHEPAITTCHEYTHFLLEGKLIFEGKANIGKGVFFNIIGGEVRIGDDFSFTGKSNIRIVNRLIIGSGCLFSWDLLLMDYDGHIIRNELTEIDNYSKEIVIGNNVWIGCDCKLMGGTLIPDGSVIGSGSFINKKLDTTNSIYINNGNRIKTNISWEKRACPDVIKK